MPSTVAVNATVNEGTSQHTLFIECLLSAYYVLSTGDTGFTFYLIF